MPMPMQAIETSFGRPLGRALLDLEWVWLALILPLIILVPERSFGLLLLTPLFWLLRRYLDGRFVPPTPLNLCLAMMAVMAGVGVWFTPDMSLTLPKAAGLAYGIALFFVVSANGMHSRRHLAAALLLLLAAGLIVTLFGLLGIRWSSIKIPILLEFMPRLAPQTIQLPGAARGVSPNQLAGTLLWLLPLFFSLSLTLLVKLVSLVHAFHWQRWLLAVLVVWPATAFFSVAFLLTQSRSAFLGFGVALVFIVLLAAWPYRYYLLASFPALLLLAYLGLGQTDGTPLSQLTGMESQRILNPDRALDEAFQDRQAIWAASIDTLSDNLWMGVGLGTGRVVVPAQYGHYFRRPQTDIAHAHNQFLQAGLDLGLPGLVAYLALWLGAAVMVWQTLRTTSDPWFRGLAAGFAGSLLAYFIYGLSDAVALGSRPGFIFWYLLGLIVAVHGLALQSRQT